MTPDLATQQLRKVPFFQFLDFMITELAETHAAATMPFAERLIGNPIMEYYHGGIIASFMEAVAAISVSHGPDLQPPKPIRSSAYGTDHAHMPRLPLSWQDSLDAFISGKMLDEFTPGILRDMVIKTKQQEMQRFTAMVTPFEYQSYLDQV